MKSRMLCACLVGMLFVSAVALGEIVKQTDWDGCGDVSGCYILSGADAFASGEETDPDSWAHGDWSLRTTEAGLFHYGYGYRASTFAWVNVIDEYPCHARASAVAGGTVGSMLSPSAYRDDSHVPDPPGSSYIGDYPDDITSSDQEGYFEVYEGVYCGHTVLTSASIWSGSYNVAWAGADAGASITFWQE